MFKKIAAVSVLGLSLVVAGTAFAETSTTSSTVTMTAPINKIACVGAAVAVRETSLDAAMTSFTQSLSSAYTARASALAAAYSASSTDAVKVGVKAAWTSFETSVKSARKTWSGARLTAWAMFRTAAKECKAPTSMSDTSSASMEVGL